MSSPTTPKLIWKKGDRVCFAHLLDRPLAVTRFHDDPENPMVEVEGMPGLYGAHIFVAAPAEIIPPEPSAGTLFVGTDGVGNVVINHPHLKPDANGVGHIIFTPNQARQLARILQCKADDAWREKH